MCLINPGAVGYPQGEEATTRYAPLTWDGEWRVEWRLVHYDVEAVIARMLAAERPYRSVDCGNVAARDSRAADDFGVKRSRGRFAYWAVIVYNGTAKV